MTTPEEAVRKYLKGIGVIPEEDPPQIARTDVLVERARRRAINFARLLRLRGFIIEISRFARMTAVDFYDPYLRDKLIEKGMKSRLY